MDNETSVVIGTPQPGDYLLLKYDVMIRTNRLSQSGVMTGMTPEDFGVISPESSRGLSAQTPEILEDLQDF